jgi:hypothetical protein
VIQQARFFLGKNYDPSGSVCETLEQRSSPHIHVWRSVTGAPLGV